MPASLERLIAEVEPAVVTDELLRDCIVVGMLWALAIEIVPDLRTRTHHAGR